MKKLFGVFSLAMLLFSTFAPNFTYATGKAEIQAQELLSNTLVDSMRTFEDTHGVANFQQSEEDINLFGNPNENNNVNAENEENDEIEIVGNNNHILWNKTKGYITVYSGDYSNGITISDRNLGADNIFDTGDYYKWGTNVTISDPYDINDYINDENAWSGENAQGPCSGGYHVPEISEYNNLMKLYFDSKNLGEFLTKNNGNYSCSNSGYINQFINDLKIPKSGWLNSVGEIINGFTFLYSSTFSKPNSVKGLFFSNNNTYMSISANALFGSPVRCFKNEYTPYSLKVKFNPNGGAFSGMNKKQIKEYTYETNENGIKPIYNIQIPDRESEDITQQSGWMFDGWYTKDGTNNDWGEEFDISNPNSTTAYAKWLPFNDLDLSIIGLTGVKIMDRNLGAEETADGRYYGYNNAGHEEYSKLGKYYQWGNNYGFKNNGTIEHSDNNPVDATSYGPKNYYMNNTFKTTDWSEAWTTESNENLWGGKEPKNPDTDKQGPCPEGYHVPDKLEWNLVYESFESKRKEEGSTLCDGFEENEKGKCFATKMLLPFAGKRGYTTQKYNHQGGCGYYWSSTPYDSDNSKYLSLDKNSIIANAEAKRSYGYSVRCFKNSSNKLTLNTDNGEDIINVRRWEKIGEYLKDIYYKGYKILGWYYDANQSIEINNSDIIKESKKIYVKWERNPWYTYNSNNGIFSDGHNERIIKSDLVKTVVTIENQKDVLRTNYFKGASSLSIGLKILNWDQGLDDEIDIYTGDSENGNPYKVISPECHEYYGCINNYKFEIPSDTITIVIHGSTANENTSYSATINANGADPYKIDKFEETPTRQGYEFSGWYEGTTGENNELIIADEEFNFEDTSVTQDRTLYAKWNPHHYTIKFNVNGGTGEVENINAIYGIGIPLPTITREGYNFEGWLSDIDNNIYSGTIEEGTGLTSEDNVIVNLTAQWKSIPAEPKEQTVSSAGGGATINSSKQESKTIEQEHNSADTEEQKTTNTQTKNHTSNTVATEEIKQQVKKVEDKSLTRGEVAVMTNILLEVYPQLVEGKQELDDVTNACSNYADEQNFTKDEKKAITRLCKLSIMGIHNDTNKPLEEFLVNNKSTNDEFSKVINRSVAAYNEKDLSTIKEALKKLEGDNENVAFGTVYEVFMSIKSIFN